MAKRTPIYERHVAADARLVDFGGWDMPLHYGSQIDEHHAVRRDAGMFDVSHMTVVDLHGKSARAFLSKLLANDVGKLTTPGRALYTCMLNEKGGVIDDLIVYYLDESFFRLVVNAATRENDLAWIRQHAPAFRVSVTEREDLAMIAVQGPQARSKAASVFPALERPRADALKPFRAERLGDLFVARTGYTGEDGYEILVPAPQAAALWDALARAGFTRCGLGARDTLRLEAGLNLYGSDMTADTSPLISGLGWTVAMDPPDRDFIGRAAIATELEAGPTQKQVGLLLEGKGVLRGGYKVYVAGAGEGEVTSGTFSPTLSRSIALARVSIDTGDACDVDIRGRRVPARVHQPPFVRHGEIKILL